MAMELFDTKHLGGTSFDLFFEIDPRSPNGDVIDGQIFDIHGLAQMKFSIRNTTDSKSEIFLSVMKHELTMMVNVEMKVICHVTDISDDPTRTKIENTFTCSEIWSQYVALLKTAQKNKFNLKVEVGMKINSRKSVLDVMYIDTDFTDFQLSTNEGIVHVHKALLASHSDVFKRMFCGEWKEATTGRIKMEGVTLSTLQNLKKYIYLGTLPEDGLCDLLRFAAYYLIDDLQTECTIKLAHLVTSENLYELLEFSYANNIPELTFTILRAVRAQPRDVIEVAHQKMIKPKPECEDVNEKK